MPRLRVILLIGVVAALFAAFLPAASADVVHLRTGEAIKGRPLQARSDDNVLTVEDYLTGAYRRFSWSAVDPADRERILEEWGWTNTGDKTVLGERIRIRLGDGSITEVRGVVVGETDSRVTVHTDGRDVEIEVSRIVDREPEELDVREVWSAAELVENYRQAQKEKGDRPVDFDDPESATARDWLSLGDYAEWCGEYHEAKAAYERAAADEAFLKRDLAEQRLVRVEALLLDEAAMKTLKEAKHKLRMRLFRRVRGILDGFAETHPTASEAVLQKLESLRSQFQAHRTTQLQTEARRNFVDIVEDYIHDKVREKDVSITDVTAWVRRQLPEMAFTKLAGIEIDEEGNPVIDEETGLPKGTGRYLNKFDDVTPEEAKALWDGRWEGRRAGTWKKISYGDGTFIVEPPTIKPPKSRRSRGGRSGSGGGARVEIPKPPTRDQWWERATTRERESWVLAFFIERSELFELTDPQYRPCNMCHGVGLLTKTLQTGDTLSYLCTQCGGARRDRIVRYR